MSKHQYKYRKSFTYGGIRYDVKADDPVELGVKYAKKLAELQDANRTVSGNTTLSHWAEECVETYKTNQSDITRKKYVLRMKSTILSEIGNMHLKKIRPMHVQKVLNLQAGKSPTQVNEVYHMLKFLFSHAYLNHLISSDPTAGLVRPRMKKRSHRRALTPEERKYFIQIGKEDRRFYLFLLMLYCGCRPEEASCCMGRDLSSESGINYLHIKGTKTALSDRFVPIPKILWELIKDTPKDEYIACTATGHRIDPGQRRRIWKNYCRRINIAMGCQIYNNELIPPYPLAPELVPYCLRHEYCTNLARMGVDIRIAQKLMGHSDIKMTANIYTNFEKNDMTEAAKTIVENTAEGI